MSHAEHQSKYYKKQGCPVKCSTEVGLDLDVKPKVSCRELWRRGTEFDVELDFKVDHNCELIPKKTYKDEKGCVTKCVFGVKLDFDCVPYVRHNPCGKPSAEFELDVELDVKPECRPIDNCKVKYSKSNDKKDDKKDWKKKEDCDCNACKKKYHKKEKVYHL